MFYLTYILKSIKTGKHYIGSCKDIEARLAEHNAGKTKSTKYGIPWKIVYSEKYSSKHDAYRREKQIKSYKGGEAFKKLIHGEIA